MIDVQELIHEVRGNIWHTSMRYVVVPVNTVGIAGAGMALQMKNLYPDAERYYNGACARGEIVVGKVATYWMSARSLVFFPTKQHWKNPSKMSYVEDGLKHLVTLKLEGGVAVPMLGAGLGGLPREQVKGLLFKHLKKLDIPVEIYV